MNTDILILYGIAIGTFVCGYIIGAAMANRKTEYWFMQANKWRNYYMQERAIERVPDKQENHYKPAQRRPDSIQSVR